jgi:hypothetical protein
VILSEDLDLTLSQRDHCVGRNFPIYHGLLERLKGWLTPEPDGKEGHVWSHVGKGRVRDIQSVLLPQVVQVLMGSTQGDGKEEGADDWPGVLGEITVLSLNTHLREQLFGSFLFCASTKNLELARKKGTGLSPDSGDFCALSDVRLVLAASGVGLLQIDLHYCEPLDLEATDEAYRDRLLAFASKAQYWPAKSRPTSSPVFMSVGPEILALEGGPLRSGANQLWDKVARQFIDAHAGGLGAAIDDLLTDVEEADLKKFRGMLEGELRKGFNIYFRQLLTALQRDVDGDDESPRARRRDDLAQWMTAGGDEPPASLLNAGEEAVTSWTQKMTPRKPGNKPIDALKGSLMASMEETLSAVVPWLKASYELPQMASLDGPSHTEAWTYKHLLALLLKQMGIRVDETGMPDLLLNGDRLIGFAHHKFAQGTPDWLTSDDARVFAARLSRLHDIKHDASRADDDEDAPGRFEPFESHLYNVSLEGLAVLQVPGQNPEFYKQNTVVRDRHYLLFLLSQVYRFSLLNFTFHSIEDKEPDAGEEIERIERLCGRMEHFTHWIYHGQVSSMSHLQELFELLLDRMNVKRLWEDTERDLPRYVERKRRLVEHQEQRRKAKFERFVSVLGSIFILVNVIDFLEKFGLSIVAVFQDLHVVWKLGILGCGVALTILGTVVIQAFIERAGKARPID